MVERAEAAEERDRAKTQKTRKLGRWEDGNRRSRDKNAKSQGEKVKGKPEGGETRPSKRKGDGSAETDQPGQAGKRDERKTGEGGPSASRDPGTPPPDVKGGAGATAILNASTQDAEILLRKIIDDPARVLQARLQAMHKQRSGGK